MKQIKTILMIFVATIIFAGCTNENDFLKGKRQLENQGYTDVVNTGYSGFCCSDSDDYSSGFTCKDKNGEVVKGCICSGFMKGITIRFE